jgi:hypothetical protein
MTECRKCGLPLKFKWLRQGKWSPINPDGTDHWDLCKSTTRRAEGIEISYEGRTGGPGYVWCGRVPPWDESLGEYRPYTDQEMQAREVCEYRP